MISNRQIGEAWVVVVAQNSWPTPNRRNLRPLVAADFARIRDAMQKVQSGWAAQRAVNESSEGPTIKYYDLRSKLLDDLTKRHQWHPATRSLYASMLAILVNWKNHGVPREHKAILDAHLPGAQLYLQFLEGYNDTLV